MKFETFEPLFGDWAIKFRPFIESKDFDEIYSFLKTESRDGKIICPKHEQTFRAFKECPFEKLKCILMLQDPYFKVKRVGNELVYTADGIAMSCSNTGELQPSLELFYEGMEDDLGVKVIRVPDLTYLANQGVLLINTSLTVEKDKNGSHSKIGLWDKFIKYLIEEVINFYTRGLIYVGIGDNAHDVGKMILPFIHWSFEVEHPAYAARQQRSWNHDNIFSKINKILKDSNSERINWGYGTVEEPISGIRGKVRTKRS